MKASDFHALLCVACALLPARAVGAQPDAAPALEERLNEQLGVPSGLTSNEVVARALATSFDVSARKAELTAAAADADRALLGYLPHLGVSASYERFSDVGVSSLGNLVVAPADPPGALPPGAQLVNVPIELKGILNQYALEANLLVPVSDYFLRVAPARSAAEHTRYAAAANVETARARVATDARVQYYSWVRARLTVLVAEQALRDAEAHLSDARHAAGAVSASPADVLRLESQVARSELLVVNTRSLAAVAEEQLRAQLHDPSRGELRIGEDIRQSPPAGSAEVAQLPQLFRYAIDHRPELESLQEDARAVGELARAERAPYVPRFDALAGAAYANPNPRVFPPEEEFRGSWHVGLRLSWLITDIPSAYLSAKATQARSEALFAERSALVDRIRVEVRAAAQAVDDSAVALRTTERGLESARESYRVRRLSFQNGRSTSVELLDAETDLTRARLERLDAAIDARVARARLDYAIGRALPTR
jgi:outer membrane protein